MRNQSDCLSRLQALGISWVDACALRRISMTLHRWHELECGIDGACIERGYYNRPVGGGPRAFSHDENGIPYWANHNGERTHYTLMPDREAGALKRLARIMKSYPDLLPYVQGDPRGASLYIVRKSDVPADGTIDAYYTRGVAVCK